MTPDEGKNRNNVDGNFSPFSYSKIMRYVLFFAHFCMTVAERNCDGGMDKVATKGWTS